MAKILTIIPYEFYPPVSGGALRCFYILREMAREHEVYLFTIQPINDFSKEQVHNFPNTVKIISTNKDNQYQSFLNYILPKKTAGAINYRILMRSLKGASSSYFLNAFPAFIKLLKKVNFDIICFENLEVVKYFSPIAKRVSSGTIQIYDAHNIDSDLWLQHASNDNPVFYKYAQAALKIEKQLYNKINIFFCCSVVDRLKLTNLNNKRIDGICIPNGVDLLARPFDTNPEKHKFKSLLFCGSLDYHPNKEGLLWFYRSVFPIVQKKLPGIVLTVIGNINDACSYNELIQDPLVNFIGKVEDVTPYYKHSSVSVVPLLSGSGTRLKILEAMSMGNPVVSTPIGAEGINCSPGVHLYVATNPDEFADSIMSLLEKEDLFNLIRLRALKLVKEEYDWKIIGNKMNERIKKLLEVK